MSNKTTENKQEKVEGNRSHSMNKRTGIDSSRDEDTHNKSMEPTIPVNVDAYQRSKGGVLTKVQKKHYFSKSLFISNFFNRDNVIWLSKFYPSQQKFAE